MDKRLTTTEVTLLVLAVLAMAAAVVALILKATYLALPFAIGAVVIMAIFLIWYAVNSKYRRTLQSDRTLKIAGETLSFMQEGLSEYSATEVCKIVLPATDATAIAISQQDQTIGFVSTDHDVALVEQMAEMSVIQQVLEDGQVRVVTAAEDMPFQSSSGLRLGSAIVVPLVVRSTPVAILALCYRSSHKISETQQALAEGFGQLLSTQLSLAELDAQTELATRMELKALQAQINPHFLFNTINTIAALIRTDPTKARLLLREFAVFYRRTLENSEDLISIEQELDQTMRYLMFERARFGDERILTDIVVEEGLNEILVPAFVVQPLVENSVQHAMREEVPLHIKIEVTTLEGRVVVKVSDDGTGMSAERIPVALQTENNSGMGIALKNVDDRLTGYFGSTAGLHIDSELDVGTTVTLMLGRRRSIEL